MARLILVPWSNTTGYGFRLMVYGVPFPKDSPFYEQPYRDCEDGHVELRGNRKQYLTMQLINNIAKKCRPVAFKFGRFLRLAVEVEVPDEIGNRLTHVLSTLSDYPEEKLKQKAFSELIGEEPCVSLERLEKALAIMQLL